MPVPPLMGNFRSSQNRLTVVCDEGSANASGHSSVSSVPSALRYQSTVMID